MANIRRGYELRMTFLGRPIRPFHLAVTIATATICYLTFLTAAEGWTDAAEIIVGASAFMASALLILGWWFRNDWAAEWGLLIAAGVWTARAVYLITDGHQQTLVPWYGSVLLSVAWAVGATGAYLLERYDRETSDDR